MLIYKKYQKEWEKGITIRDKLKMKPKKKQRKGVTDKGAAQ